MKIGTQPLNLSELRQIARGELRLELDPGCLPALRAGFESVERIVSSGKPAYGINTGFGRLSQTRIPAEELEQLQANIVLSHAAGTGPLLDDAAVRRLSARGRAAGQGAVAQLGGRDVCTVEVVGSNPIGSTKPSVAELVEPA